MPTLREITRCRSRAERVGMCIEWLRRNGVAINIVLSQHGYTVELCLRGYWQAVDSDSDAELDALLLDACRRVEKENK